MTDKTPVERKLAKLAGADAVVDKGWRKLPGGASDDPLSSLLTEIDETVLPAFLDLRSGDGAVLHLVAGNRRLIRLTPPLPESFAGRDALVETDLAQMAAEDVDALGGLLRTLAEEAGHWWVRGGPSPAAEAPGNIGLSPKALAERWHVDWDGLEPDPTEAFEAFATALADRAESYVRLTGDDGCEGTGAREDFAAADAYGRALVEASGGFTGRDGPRLVFFGPDDGVHVAMAAHADTRVVAIVESETLPDLADAWRQAGL